MKTVYLLRHAKGETPDVQKPDIERVLAPRGETDTELVGSRMASQELKPSVIITSPAIRAKITATIFAKQVDYHLKNIRVRKALYDEEESSYLAILHSLGVNFGSVMLVGHNPALSAFARQLCPEFKQELPTCGLAVIEFDCRTWKVLTPGEGKLKLYEYPKRVEEKPKTTVSRKTRKKNLAAQLAATIGEVLEKHDLKAVKKVRRQITKASRQIAGKFIDAIGKITEK